ncbi:ankyrin repeat domain-containing protein [Paenibacillus sp. FSL K6-1230]|uniref:ankyrin repeat domain-containing protein n=1 Tax=Paenibacillus sp. FSL K6-1230 TaxID=2921603 RepID=UPI0030FAA899
MTQDVRQERNEKMKSAGFENTLNYACATGNMEEIRRMLSSIKATALNKKCSYFGTSLHIACEDGALDIVQWLVEAGADLEVRNTVQETPLLWALHHGHEDVARYLMDQGANIMALGCKKESALFLSAAYASGAMTQKLIDLGLDVNQLATAKINALEWTTNTGNVEGASVLIDNGIHPETITPAFWWACRRNRRELAELLLSKGADISCVYDRSCELLIYTVFNEYEDIIGLLVDHGVDFNRKVKYNKNFIKFEGTPLERAAQLGQDKIVSIIGAS